MRNQPQQQAPVTWPFPGAPVPSTKPTYTPPLLWGAIEATRHPDWKPDNVPFEEIWWRSIV